MKFGTFDELLAFAIGKAPALTDGGDPVSPLQLGLLVEAKCPLLIGPPRPNPAIAMYEAWNYLLNWSKQTFILEIEHHGQVAKLAANYARQLQELTESASRRFREADEPIGLTLEEWVDLFKARLDEEHQASKDDLLRCHFGAIMFKIFPGTEGVLKLLWGVVCRPSQPIICGTTGTNLALTKQNVETLFVALIKEMGTPTSYPSLPVSPFVASFKNEARNVLMHQKAEYFNGEILETLKTFDTETALVAILTSFHTVFVELAQSLWQYDMLPPEDRHILEHPELC